MSTPRRIAAAILGVALVTTLGACSTRPPADEVYLYYMNGPTQAKEFKECVEPNTEGSWQANNDVFALPTNLRTWNVLPEGGDTKDPIVAGTKPDDEGRAGPQVHVYTSIEFYLNTSCVGGATSPAVQFWEKTGRRHGISSPDGEFSLDKWREMLRNTLVPVLLKTVQGVSRDFTADELDVDLNDAWKKAEEAMAVEFATQLRAKVGGNYFCGPTYNRKKKKEGEPECPPVRVAIYDANYADPTLQEARNAVRKAAEEAEKRLIEARAQVDEAAILAKASRDPNYMRLKELETALAVARACSANPNCTLIVGDANGVNVNAK